MRTFTPWIQGEYAHSPGKQDRYEESRIPGQVRRLVRPVGWPFACRTALFAETFQRQCRKLSGIMKSGPECPSPPRFGQLGRELMITEPFPLDCRKVSVEIGCGARPKI